MTDQNNPNYCYTNKLSRIIFFLFEEIIGQYGLSALLNYSELSCLINNFPNDNEPGLHFEEISRNHLDLEQLYGYRGGGGLSLRSGRVFFKNGLKEFGEIYGITETDFRLLPLEKKLSAGIKKLARILNDHSNQQVSLRENADRILWTVVHCPICWHR